MPKSPILERTTYYTKLSDGSMRRIQFQLVQTSLGPMVEPTVMAWTGVTGVLGNPIDAFDASVTRLEIMDEGAFYATFGTGGNQLPIDFSIQGA